jgi:hypothetical protein
MAILVCIGKDMELKKNNYKNNNHSHFNYIPVTTRKKNFLVNAAQTAHINYK